MGNDCDVSNVFSCRFHKKSFLIIINNFPILSQIPDLTSVFPLFSGKTVTADFGAFYSFSLSTKNENFYPRAGGKTKL
jgi:hypothetical protein